MWNKRVKEDFWQKELEHIGQQPILNKEIRGDHATPEGTFAYQDRYDEYRRLFSQYTGDFADSVANSWHLAHLYASDPSLNADFVTCEPSSRIFAEQTEDHLYAMMHHNLKARRMLSKQATNHIF
jgi:hypothetical protein